ncbi:MULTISPECIES: sugar transferase [Janthinobacterium]|jgi:O-antigen biosynthesis protein WbqP|uniref:Sugar transferase n=1 Tax=Janthinobacterium lividum TaxID=29581 RepID=A0ABU0XUZ2_9BURK|nr:MULTISPECIES: sugar transferase [Janthinobacterium]MBR7632973.1 sugar transferase [Janthinobacterium lividum]MCC7695605.1 sugar transferase [Janthinobacterium sp. EB271-G4-7A]MCC7713840.1 sugar transferase [Janthinobacterium lividum]MDQ4626256.1 sugar transferase [Janthinobacterium lividum]MDQ4674777.1 sugar transferase [Janthinobacterium lividum]
MKRLFDVSVALLAVVVLSIPLLVVAVLVKLTSPGPIVYWSDRVGRHNRIFRMPKFRTMRVDTPAVATHLLSDPKRFLTPVGPFLRKSSLDELPQLWSILAGDMSFVGPRPALFNQDDLIALRTEYGVDQVLPGLTGWAQINGRDELPIPDKVRLDAEYLQRQSFFLDLKIIFLTFLKVVRRDGITH